MDKGDIDKEVFDILNTAKPIKSDNRRTFRTALIALTILIVAGSAFAMYSVLTAPRGEIVSPAPGTLTSRVVEIEGCTKNITPSHGASSTSLLSIRGYFNSKVRSFKVNTGNIESIHVNVVN